MAKRVLIAEDNWLTPTVLRSELESHGYQVIGVARTGIEAVTQTRAASPDVVLMDIQMPELDGIQATRVIMGEQPTCVVIVTGRAELSQAAEESGAMAYLVKPFMPDEIVGVVQEALGRYQWYELVRGESADAYEALQAWPQVQKAIRVIADRDRVPEARAFEELRGLGSKRGAKLRAVAREILEGSPVRAAG